MQGVPSFLRGLLGEVTFEEGLADGRALRAYLAKATAPELIAGGVIHWPVAGNGVLLCKGKPVAEVGQPLFELVYGAVGEAATKDGFALFDLCSVDYNPADRGVKDDFGGEGVEGHLV